MPVTSVRDPKPLHNECRSSLQLSLRAYSHQDSLGGHGWIWQGMPRNGPSSFGLTHFHTALYCGPKVPGHRDNPTHQLANTESGNHPLQIACSPQKNGATQNVCNLRTSVFTLVFKIWFSQEAAYSEQQVRQRAIQDVALSMIKHCFATQLNLWASMTSLNNLKISLFLWYIGDASWKNQ